MRGAWPVAVVGLLACKIPSTLGLPCNEDEHCDAGQYCATDQTCQMGSAPGETSASTAAPPTSSTGPIATSTSPTPPTTEPTPGTGSASSSSTDDSTTEVPATCGAAVGTCDNIDVLFLVDNSGSMGDDILPIAAAFLDDALGLVGLLSDGICTFQVGVTTTEPDLDFQPKPCRVRGALNSSSALLNGAPCSGDLDHPPWLTQDDPPTGLTCYLTVGMRNEPDEHQMETVLAALGPDLNAPGQCNAGFVRDDAVLIVIIVTDEDDDDDSANPGEAGRTGSPGSPDDWYDELLSLKRPENLGVILVAGNASKGCDWEPMSGNDDGSGAERPVRLTQLLDRFTTGGYADHIEQVNICTSPAGLSAEVSTFDSFVRNVCEDAVYD